MLGTDMAKENIFALESYGPDLTTMCEPRSWARTQMSTDRIMFAFLFNDAVSPQPEQGEK